MMMMMVMSCFCRGGEMVAVVMVPLAVGDREAWAGPRMMVDLVVVRRGAVSARPLMVLVWRIAIGISVVVSWRILTMPVLTTRSGCVSIGAHVMVMVSLVPAIVLGRRGLRIELVAMTLMTTLMWAAVAAFYAIWPMSLVPTLTTYTRVPTVAVVRLLGVRFPRSVVIIRGFRRYYSGVGN